MSTMHSHVHIGSLHSEQVEQSSSDSTLDGSENSSSSSTSLMQASVYSSQMSIAQSLALRNSCSSIPSPVYQWTKARFSNIELNWRISRRKTEVIAVVLARNVADALKPLGGMSQIAVLMLFGIHLQNFSLLIVWTSAIASSTSFDDTSPRKIPAHVKYFPQLEL